MEHDQSQLGPPATDVMWAMVYIIGNHHIDTLLIIPQKRHVYTPNLSQKPPYKFGEHQLVVVEGGVSGKLSFATVAQAMNGNEGLAMPGKRGQASLEREPAAGGRCGGLFQIWVCRISCFVGVFTWCAWVCESLALEGLGSNVGFEDHVPLLWPLKAYHPPGTSSSWSFHVC